MLVGQDKNNNVNIIQSPLFENEQLTNYRRVLNIRTLYYFAPSYSIHTISLSHLSNQIQHA